MKKFKSFPLLLALCLLFCTACADRPDGGSAEHDPAAPDIVQTEIPQPDILQPEISQPEISQENLGFEVSQTLADFTFTTYDGKEISLYETLAEKELVVINFWATWCPPCGAEFPHMEEAYGQLKDSVEIFALSTDPNDSDEALAEYAADMGMSFPVGRDSAALSSDFRVTAIPTTVLVDRYGTICSIEVGAQTSAEAFVEIFTPYLAEDYSGIIAPSNAFCQVEPSSEAQLAETLNAEGGSIVFQNPQSDQLWPFVVTENQGRSAAVSSNARLSNTTAVISAEVDAQAGQVLCITFSLSCEACYDVMRININGETVKSFNSSREEGTYAFPITESGLHTLEISYSKDEFVDFGEDCLRLYRVALLSGDEAEAALAANPVYPHHDTTAIIPLAAGAKELLVQDPQNLLLPEDMVSRFRFWIVPEGETDLKITVDENIDPDSTFISTDFDGSSVPLSQCRDGDAYRFSTQLDSLDTTGYAYSQVTLASSDTKEYIRYLVLFSSVEDADSLLTYTDSSGQSVISWSYADGSPKDASDSAPGEVSEVSYVVSCVDTVGAPVPGVTVQICDDTLCQLYTSDADGLCTFTLPPYAYEIHILSVPEGYTYGNDAASTLSADGGRTEYVFQKAD